MDEDIVITKLDTADLTKVSGFRMAEEEDKPLEQFIRRVAKKSADAHLTQTFVIKRSTSPEVLAYISLMCAEVKLENTYSITDKANADRYEYQPAIRIARLAVCDECQKNGWGRKLVQTAIGITIESIRPYAGCRFLILDAKQKSVAFYIKIGFRLLDTADNISHKTPLMFMDLGSVHNET